MKTNGLAIATILLSAVSACSSTGVVPMSQDSYMIGKKDGSPGLGVSLNNKAAVLREANEFCVAKGLEAQVLHETVTPARPGRLGSTEIQFRCVHPGSAARTITKDADTVVRVETPTPQDAYSQLLKLDELRKKGVITEDEFQAQKAKLLSE